jgi:hypothetical protein
MLFFSMGVFQHAHFGNVLSFEGNWPLRWLLGLITWVFVGYGYGRSQWRRNEEDYQQQRRGNQTG